MNSYYQMLKCYELKQRISRAMILVTIAFLILLSRLFYLQIIEGEDRRRISENNCVRLYNIDAPRGLIFDRNGEIIADNRPAFDLNITIKDAKPLDQTIQKLSSLTGISTEDIYRKISLNKGTPSFKPIQIIEDMDRNLMAVVEANRFQLPGVSTAVKSKRFYSSGCASHVIGYLGEISPEQMKNSQYAGYASGDYVGKFGLEKVYETILRGKKGGQQVEVNASGQIYRILKTVHPLPGNNLTLTIDARLQEKAEELIRGMPGAIVAMNPFNGEILAMVSSPAFDPNFFVKKISHKDWRQLISNPFRPMENKAIQGEYPPASTYKIIPAMAAIELGIAREKEYIFCPGYYEYNGRAYRCWKKGGHGHVNIYSALAGSCDVYFYQIGLRLGVDRLAEFAAACGLGSKTGISLENESRGLVPSSEWKKRAFGEPWQQGETLSVAIGQSYNLATPLQMLVLTSAIANGGTLYRPELIKRDDNMPPIVTENRKLPISQKTLNIIRKGLWDVVNSPTGTARGIASDQLKISGKTGTAQIIGKKSDDSNEILEDRHKPHAWFIAYSDSFPIAVVVLVENGEGGSSTAAPLARKLIEYYSFISRS